LAGGYSYSIDGCQSLAASHSRTSTAAGSSSSFASSQINHTREEEEEEEEEEEFFGDCINYTTTTVNNNNNNNTTSRPALCSRRNLQSRYSSVTERHLRHISGNEVQPNLPLQDMEPESDAGDVNEFLLRIKELGDKRNREDEERVKNIEDEILAGRKARKAKREGMDLPWAETWRHASNISDI